MLLWEAHRNEDKLDKSQPRKKVFCMPKSLGNIMYKYLLRLLSLSFFFFFSSKWNLNDVREMKDVGTLFGATHQFVREEGLWS